IRAVGGQRAGGIVRDVTELGDRRLHDGACGVAHPGRAVDHPGNRAPAHPGARGHLFESGPAAASAPRSVACHRPRLPSYVTLAWNLTAAAVTVTAPDGRRADCWVP